MSSPPLTSSYRPTSSHRRHPSSLDMSHTAPSGRYSSSRRSSGYSPITPRSSQHFEHGSPAQHFDGGGDNDLGNLADELGGDWSEDEEGEYTEDLDLARSDTNGVGVAVNHVGPLGDDRSPTANGVRDSGVAMRSSSPDSKNALSPQTAARKSARRNPKPRSLYDGSDYGGDSDLEESQGISAALEKQMAAVESLARRKLEANGSASDEVVKRVVERLRDLGSQSSIEGGTTRLKTAHDALTGNLTHQSRILSSLSSAFTGPRAIIPDPETIESLLLLITSTLEMLPHASAEPVYELSQLSLSTREFLQHLANVSDSLHMSRQSTNDASRRLRSVKDQVAELKRESEQREQGISFIEQGQWDRRLQEREAKRACSSVVDGFEEICGMWRKRLCEGLGEVSA